MVSGTHRKLREGAAHASWSEFYFVDPIPSQPLMCGHHTQNLLVLKCPQLTLHPDSEVCAGMDLCRKYMCFSPESKGSAMPSQSKIGRATAGSVGSASPALLNFVGKFTDCVENKLLYGMKSIFAIVLSTILTVHYTMAIPVFSQHTDNTDVWLAYS